MLAQSVLAAVPNVSLAGINCTVGNVLGQFCCDEFQNTSIITNGSLFSLRGLGFKNETGKREKTRHLENGKEASTHTNTQRHFFPLSVCCGQC